MIIAGIDALRKNEGPIKAMPIQTAISPKTPAMNNLINEINSIRNEISRLDSKIKQKNQSTIPSNRQMPLKNVSYNSQNVNACKTTRAKKDINKFFVTKPPIAWREGDSCVYRKENIPCTPNIQTHKEPTIYPSWWGHPDISEQPILPPTGNENNECYEQKEYQQPYVNEYTKPMRIIRQNESGKEQKATQTFLVRGGGYTVISRKQLRQEKEKNKKKHTVPSYLRHVGSKISRDIEEDKRKYRTTTQMESQQQYTKPQEEENPREDLEEQQYPTLGKKEESVLKMTDQCLSSSIVNHFSQDRAQQQSHDQIREQESSAKFQYSPEKNSNIREDNITSSLNERASKEELARKSSNEGQQLRKESQYSYNPNSIGSNENRVPYSEIAHMPSNNINPVEIPAIGSTMQNEQESSSLSEESLSVKKGQTVVSSSPSGSLEDESKYFHI